MLFRKYRLKARCSAGLSACIVPRYSIGIAIEKEKFDPSLPLAFKLARLFGMPIEKIFSDNGGDNGDGPR